MSENPISQLMTETMAKIKEMVDVNTIIGDPVVTQDGTTIIPVSKVTFGFGSGGSEFSTKHSAQNAPLAFGGGGAAGVTVAPVCFLIVGRDGSANILGVNAQASTTVDRLVEMLPGAMNKFSSFMEGRKGKKESSAEQKSEQSPDSDA